MASARITVTLDAKTAGQLAVLCRESGQTKSVVVRDAIQRRFAQRGKMSAERQSFLLRLIDSWKREAPLRTKAEIQSEIQTIRRARRAIR
jgi:predicted transcriptional regulator